MILAVMEGKILMSKTMKENKHGKIRAESAIMGIKNAPKADGTNGGLSLVESRSGSAFR